MNFDYKSHLAAVNRSVSMLERDGQPASAVILARSYQTPIDNLWDAVRNPERIPLWFMPISGDIKLGGRYQLEGNAGGIITACEPPSRLTLTWEFAGDVSWVEVTVSQQSTGLAHLTLTHTALISEHWYTYGPGATGVGWEMGFLGLALYLADPDFAKPDPTEFAFSPSGKAMLTGSSEQWGEASIDAGTEPDAARTAAMRTTAFYTGEEPSSSHRS